MATLGGGSNNPNPTPAEQIFSQTQVPDGTNFNIVNGFQVTEPFTWFGNLNQIIGGVLDLFNAIPLPGPIGPIFDLLDDTVENAILRLSVVFSTLMPAEDALQLAQALTNGGQAISDAQADYLLDAATNYGASTTMLADLKEGLELLSKNGTKLPEDLLVNFVRLVIDPATVPESGQLKIDVSSTSEDVMLAAYLPDLEGLTLALAGMEKVLVLGEGTVKIDGGQPGMIVGDRFNQVIIGGGGSDTLVGGGGSDTLTGGSSPDVFGFNALGHYTITDFITGYDKLAFEVPGVTSKAALQAFLTSVTNTGGNTTFNFGPDASITLVGVNVSGLFDDMLFNIS